MNKILSFAATLLLTLATLTTTGSGALAQPAELDRTVTNETEYRDALVELSADNTAPHTITLGADITITGAVDPSYTGDQPLTIDGQGLFALDGGGTRQVLDSSGVRPLLTLTGLTVRNGSSTTNGGGISWKGPVTVMSSTFSDNEVEATLTVGVRSAGALSTNGVTTITDSSFVNNSVVVSGGNAKGGAVSTNLGGSSVVATRSTFIGNSVETDTGSATGGAISSQDALTSEDSVFRRNSVEGPGSAGGAVIFIQPSVIRGTVLDQNAATSTGAGSSSGGSVSTTFSSVTLTDSSITNNTVTGTTVLVRGAAVYAGGDIALVNSTVAENDAASTTGTREAPVRAGGAVTLLHATVHDNTTDSTVNGVQASSLTSEASAVTGGTAASCSISGGTTSNGHNWESGDTCGFSTATDIDNGGDPQLGRVRNNGDLVAAAESPAEAGGNGTARLSAYPLNGSPLIDAIPEESCSADEDLDLDQRGVPRPFGEGCDIGAIEAVFPAHTFSDATPFFESTIRWVTSEVNTPQILNGFPDGTFGQELNITRGQAARLYYRGAGAPDASGLPAHGFPDVTPFYEDAVKWAKDAGLFNGFPDGTFRQGDPITRGQYIRSLYNFAGAQDTTDLDEHGLSDVTPFYEDAVKWAKARGLANGFPDDTFRQNDNIKRGNAGRTFYNNAQTPLAWNDTMAAPPNMLFKNNLAP